MAEERPERDSTGEVGDPNGAASDRQAAPRTPRWVQAFGLIVLIIVVLFVAAQLLFGVQHGPGLHAPSG